MTHTSRCIKHLGTVRFQVLIHEWHDTWLKGASTMNNDLWPMCETRNSSVSEITSLLLEGLVMIPVNERGKYSNKKKDEIKILRIHFQTSQTNKFSRQNLNMKWFQKRKEHYVNYLWRFPKQPFDIPPHSIYLSVCFAGQVWLHVIRFSQESNWETPYQPRDIMKQQHCPCLRYEISNL